MRSVDQRILQNMRHGKRGRPVSKKDYIPADQREGWNPKAVERLPGFENRQPRQVVWQFDKDWPTWSES